MTTKQTTTTTQQTTPTPQPHSPDVVDDDPTLPPLPHFPLDSGFEFRRLSAAARLWTKWTAPRLPAASEPRRFRRFASDGVRHVRKSRDNVVNQRGSEYSRERTNRPQRRNNLWRTGSEDKPLRLLEKIKFIKLNQRLRKKKAITSYYLISRN